MEFTQYRREDAQVHDWDPSSLEVFEFVRSRIAAELPDAMVEHTASVGPAGCPLS